MTSSTPTPELSLPLPADRVRMIRQSMRCFVFGLLGVIPLFGLGLAWLALVLHRQLARESGDSTLISFPNICCIVAIFELAIFFMLMSQGGLVLSLGLLMSALQAFFLFRQFSRTEPLHWNPARHLAYWGVWLACVGLILSVTIALLFIGSFIRFV